MTTTVTSAAPWITSSQECTLQTCPLSYAHISYLPNLAGNSFYVAVFASLIPVQLLLGFYTRTWGFVVPIICGLILEVLGYVARIKMRANPFIDRWFTMYMVCLTIAPAFISAAIYLSLARIIGVYTTSASRIKQRTYSLIFVAFDVVSLLLQAAGGAITTSNDASTVQTGINIMIAGLASQVASLTLYLAVCVDFGWRIYRSQSRGIYRYRSTLQGRERKERLTLSSQFARLRASKMWAAFLICQGLATICIYIRSIFRVAELSGGFNGYLANNEITFMVLEGAMISIAAIALSTFGHSGIGFQGQWSQLDYAVFSRKQRQIS
ncbi:Sphingoid long-chain base transporter RSB1 [Penicillium rolfsii]|nr:Sphingoid long-chain base transporter RSB1 [Penicillium rolfsii]